MKKNDYLFRVKTIEDMKGIPAGTNLYVEKELKNYYKGLCVIMDLSFHTKFPKNKCTKLEDKIKCQ